MAFRRTCGWAWAPPTRIVRSAVPTGRFPVRIGAIVTGPGGVRSQGNRVHRPMPPAQAVTFHFSRGIVYLAAVPAALNSKLLLYVATRVLAAVVTQIQAVAL